jgi:hypothetical protein
MKNLLNPNGKVDAGLLHNALRICCPESEWIKTTLETFELLDGYDYWVNDGCYEFSVECAKILALLDGSLNGRTIRHQLREEEHRKRLTTVVMEMLSVDYSTAAVRVEQAFELLQKNKQPKAVQILQHQVN